MKRFATICTIALLAATLSGCGGNFADFVDLFGMGSDSLGVCQGGEKEGADCEMPSECPGGKCVEKQ